MLAGVGCSDLEDDGLSKFPVRGIVLVNGEPAERMAITFHNTDPAAPGNAARPVAVTDAEGRYELSTNGEKDGAVEGEYIVTFFWATDNGPSASDRLNGQFVDPKRSKWKVRVGQKENNLEPFRLVVEPRTLRAARTEAVVQ